MIFWKKTNISLSFLLSLLLEIHDKATNNFLLSEYLNMISLLLYFTQVLGYLTRMNLDYYEPKVNFVLNAFFYSNFSNFLLYFKSRNLVIFAYSLVILLLFGFFLYFIILAFLKLFYKKWKNLVILKIMNIFFAYFFIYFFWIMVVPFLEILMNPLFCDQQEAYLNSCSDNFQSFLMIPTYIGVIMVIIIGFVHLYVNCNYKFLDLEAIHLKFNFYTIMMFAMRCFIPIMSMVLKNNQYIIFISMHLFALLSFSNHIINFPIRSSTMNSLYFSFLISFEAILMCLTFEIYIKVLIEESLFYSMMISILISFKLGWSYYAKKKYNILLSNFSDKKFLDYSYEEILYLFNHVETSKKNYFMLLGMLNFHSKNCNEPSCKIKQKTMKKFFTLTIQKQASLINSFISHGFIKEIELQCKNRTHVNEILIFKYIGYLLNSNINTSKVFYETQKIRLLYKNRSFLGSILINILLKRVQRKIREIEREKLKLQNENTEKTLEISSFFRVSREKVYLEGQMQKLLQIKINFWEKYKEGFESYDNFIKGLYKFFNKITHFEENLENIWSIALGQQERVVSMRFYSIFYCIILNQLPETLKYEELIDNIKKRFISVNNDKEKLTPIIFLKENLVVCEASFLNNDGKILESSKTEKLAKFFGYEYRDLKLLNSINSFMPEFLANFHSKLVFWSFLKTRKEQITKGWEVVSHAIDKEGFIFPVKLFFGFNFNYTNDYVANTGILRLQENGYEEVLMDESGIIVGINREFFNFFKSEYPKITRQQLLLISLYSLAPKLKELIENEKVFQEKKTLIFRNSSCSMALPSNLMAIIELLQFYKMEIENENQYSQFLASNVTMKTVKSNKSLLSDTNKGITTSAVGGVFKSFRVNKDLFLRLNNFLTKAESLKSKKDVIIDIFQNQSITPETLLNKMIESNNLKKCKINFDLTFKYHRYGKTDDSVISLSHMIITKISNIKHVSNTKSVNQLNFQNTIHIEESPISEISKSIIMPPQNLVDLGIEFERNEINSMSKNERSNKSENHPSLENFEHIFENKNQSSKRVVQTSFLSINAKENVQGIITTLLTEERGEKNGLDQKSFQKISFKSSSQTSDDKARRVDLLKVGHTTEQFFVKEMDLAASQNSSSNTTGKKAFNVLIIINELQKKLPKAMILLTYLLVLQFSLILAYCIIYYILAGNFISDTYIPLRTSAFNQLQVNQQMAVMTTVMTQLENLQKGRTNLSDFKINELYNILTNSYTHGTSIFKKDRNTNRNFGYTEYQQNMRVTYVDFQDYTVKKLLLNDWLDTIFDIFNIIITTKDVNKFLDIINVIQRNYMYYLIDTLNLRNLMKAEFQNSNVIVTNQLVILLAVALSLVGLFKCVEFVILNKFYQKITRLLNIFLRVNIKEAMNEITFLKEISENFKDQSKSYMNIYFSDQVLNKKNYNLEVDDPNLPKKSNSIKNSISNRKKNYSVKNAKHTSAGLKPFSKFKILMFLGVSASASICYFSFDYYFWLTCNTNIQSLLVRTDIFNNLYLFTATVLTFNNLLLREQTTRDPLYEATKEQGQIHSYRLTLLYTYLISRKTFLITYMQQLPQYSLSAETDLKDPMFTQIINGNMCQVLSVQSLITDAERDFCETTFDGAFLNGLLTGLTEEINYIKSMTYITDMTINLTASQQQKRLDDITDYVKSSTYADSILATYFINEVLLLYYNYFSNYYLTQLYSNIANLTLFVWIMCTACVIFIISLLVICWKFLKRLYRTAASTLSLIPLEKLSADEQTIFLIRSFYKDNI